MVTAMSTRHSCLMVLYVQLSVTFVLLSTVNITLMLHYIIKRGKKEVRAFYLNPMSFSLFLFDFSSANLFELLL